MDYVTPILNGDRLSLSRLITRVENDTPEGRASLDALFPYTGKAHLIGVTGSPGTGKSSLVNRLTYHFRHPTDDQKPLTVAVVAVDPTSPFSGGALLGDRVRMRDLAGDPGVYIRSMASRGKLGGLAKNTSAVVQVLDAAGFDLIMIETVGAGQSEVDIARLAHTTLVVEAPGLGDDIQAIKAGILEIADILVVNKSDHPGAQATIRALRAMLEMAHPVHRPVDLHHLFSEMDTQVMADAQPGQQPWQVPVMATNAVDAEGITELANMIITHGLMLKETGLWHAREKMRIINSLEMLLTTEIQSRWSSLVDAGFYRSQVEALCKREASPFEVVDHLFRHAAQNAKTQDKNLFLGD